MQIGAPGDTEFEDHIPLNAYGNAKKNENECEYLMLSVDDYITEF